MQGNQVEVYGHLEGFDIGVIVVYLLFSVGLGVMFARRGTRDAEAYFVGGRGLPWWLVGFGLSATCFAADTPLWIGDMIYRRGIEGAWLYWITGVGFAFYVFVIAPLWRRSHIITDLEFLELRYSGAAAKYLRMLNSLYYSTVFNLMMMGVSTLSITTVMQATTGLPKGYCVLITMGGALIYCVVSGMWGIAATDFMQFFVTFIGSAFLAGFALVAVGGKAELVSFLQSEQDWAGHELNVVPGMGAAAGLPFLTIVYIVFLRWWDNAAIGQYVSQRLFAARNTRHATLGAMLHSLIYWSVVPMPWVITILAARKLMPEMTAGQEAYPRMAMSVLPIGLKGLIVASMLAAFMSTYSSLLSWGSSYAVNDFYRRFLNRDAQPRHYVRMGQFFMIPMALGSALIAYKAESIFNLLAYLSMVPAATWTVLLLRWLWWRVNAWCEVTALAAGAVITLCIMALRPEWLAQDTMEQHFGRTFLTIILGSAVVWIAVMFLTKPVDASHLDAFVKRVNPPGWWDPVRRRVAISPDLTWGEVISCWLIMIVAIFGPLNGFLQIFFGSTLLGIGFLILGAGAIFLATRRALRMNDDGSYDQITSVSAAQ